MYTYKNLYIIGTSHIAAQSIKEVEQAILDIKPNIVAIELDPKRFQSLIHKKKTKLRLRDMQKVGFKGFLFNALGAWVEKKLGKSVGILPGSEMKKAVETAYKVKADLALIDQDIEITLKKLSQTLTWKEKFRFLIDILKSLFTTNKVKFDLTKATNEELAKRLEIAKDEIEFNNITKEIEKRTKVGGVKTQPQKNVGVLYEDPSFW